MRTVLQVSDIHFGAYFLPQVAESLLVLAEERRPDVLVVSGDLTQRAKTAQFRDAGSFLDRFGCPRVVVPGNHDVPLYRVWERVFAPYGAYRKHYRRALEDEFIDDQLCILGVNTSFNWTTKHGHIRRRRIREVRDSLQAHSGRFRIVVAHHPLVVPDLFEGERLAHRARRAVEAFSRAGADLVLAGHVHQFFLASAADFYPSLGDRLRLLHCGTTTSSRGRGAERGSNSCNWLEIDGRQIRVTQLVWNVDGGFLPSRTEVWDRECLPDV